MELFGTLGPACNNEEILYQMFEMGMTGMRLNLSHVSLLQSEDMIRTYQRAAERAGVQPHLMVDLQGPELRTGDLPAPLLLVKNETIWMGGQDFPVPPILLQGLEEDMEVLLDDGSILLRVSNCEPNRAKCLVLRGGTLCSRKSIAVPSLSISLPPLTQSDIENLSIARRYGVTSVLQPFVRGREDLMVLRSVLEQSGLDKIKIVAKIENQEGLRLLDEIIQHTDEICIARGDLGNDMPLWELPEAQKHIAAACRQAKKPFIVVTQMLHSMIFEPVPTRAEANDIFNAVLDGATTLMLTAETAIGKYPVLAMHYLNKTAMQSKKFKGDSMENKVLQVIKNRRSVRAFSGKPVSREVLSEIVEAAGYAPSSRNSQLWIFSMVTGDALEELRVVVRDMFRTLEYRSDMPPFFLACKEKALADDFSFYYGAPALLIIANQGGNRNAAADCAAAMENALIAAAALGVGSCWISTLAGARTFVGVKEALQSLGVPTGYHVLASAAFGYPDVETIEIPERTYEAVNWYD